MAASTLPRMLPSSGATKAGCAEAGCAGATWQHALPFSMHIAIAAVAWRWSPRMLAQWEEVWLAAKCMEQTSAAAGMVARHATSKTTAICLICFKLLSDCTHPTA